MVNYDQKLLKVSLQTPHIMSEKVVLAFSGGLDTTISVSWLMKKHNLFPEEIIVVLDDLNLEIGKLRLRLNGSSGGHNGLKSIISNLQTLNFPRLRVGIGPPANGDNQIDHVLGIIPKHQKDVVLASIEKASGAIICSLETGFDSAMASYN